VLTMAYCNSFNRLWEKLRKVFFNKRSARIGHIFFQKSTSGYDNIDCRLVAICSKGSGASRGWDAEGHHLNI